MRNHVFKLAFLGCALGLYGGMKHRRNKAVRMVTELVEKEVLG